MKISDSELIRKLLYLKRWTQSELADAIYVSQASVSLVVSEKHKLRSKTRAAIERMIAEAEQEAEAKAKEQTEED
jgi:transcriptional regulator with XRE-family HTH domain